MLEEKTTTFYNNNKYPEIFFKSHIQNLYEEKLKIPLKSRESRLK